MTPATVSFMTARTGRSSTMPTVMAGAQPSRSRPFPPDSPSATTISCWSRGRRGSASHSPFTRRPSRTPPDGGEVTRFDGDHRHGLGDDDFPSVRPGIRVRLTYVADATRIGGYQ